MKTIKYRALLFLAIIPIFIIAIPVLVIQFVCDLARRLSVCLDDFMDALVVVTGYSKFSKWCIVKIKEEKKSDKGCDV